MKTILSYRKKNLKILARKIRLHNLELTYSVQACLKADKNTIDYQFVCKIQTPQLNFEQRIREHDFVQNLLKLHRDIGTNV